MELDSPTGAALSRQAFAAAGTLQLLADRMADLDQRTDGYAPADLAEVANELHGMAIRLALGTGDTVLIGDMLGRDVRVLRPPGENGDAS
jgi:hypothetical protein